MKHVAATISIPNGRNVVATIKLEGYGADFRIGWPSSKKEVAPRSCAFVYVKNAVQSAERVFSSNAIGTRQPGDSLVHFESRNVTNFSRFPSRSFEYSGDVAITYVGFSFNVSHHPQTLSHTFCDPLLLCSFHHLSFKSCQPSRRVPELV